MNRAVEIVASWRFQSCVAIVLALVASGSAQAQVDAMPDAGYYVAVNEFYAGQYREAERAFRRMTRTGMQAAQARWIDSICYQAMLGEVLYQQGRNAEALAAFDQACLLLLSYPNFLRSVQFSEPRPEANPTRAIPPWGTSSRRFQLGSYPRAMPIAMGSMTGPRDALQRGGTFLQPQIWRINVTEVIRTAALAIRRRNELLGPLGKHDRISKELAATMSRSNLAQPNHWSQAWTQLLSGIARAGVGDPDEARARLERSIIVGGMYDHPLTGVALLELGKLALAAGDHKAAAQLLFDASAAGYAFEDLDVVTESLRLGWVNFLVGGGPGVGGVGGVYGPLDPAAAWAQANRLWHVAGTLRLAQAENLLRIGQPAAAATIVEDLGRRLGEMRTARLGLQQLFLQALVQIGRGQAEPASGSLNRSLAGQRLASLKNFQIARAAELYDTGEVTARVAPEVFRPLLSDPRPADWAQHLFDTLAVSSTPHSPAFDRWFLAALERKDVPQAIEVAERSKRVRFLETLPLGGRLLALRALLEMPPAELNKEAAVERQQLLASFPEYGRLAAAATQLGQQLRAGTLKPEQGADGQKFVAALDVWAKNVATREDLLLAMALSPVPARQLFPPLRTTEELQQSLAEGQALVVFHAAGGNLFGFLVSGQAEHTWVIGELEPLRGGLAEWLRALGNYSASRAMGGEELAGDEWRGLAAKIWTGLFADSRLDLARTTDLVIVPDSWLWYLPFEALVPPPDKKAAGDAPMLVERVPLHYGPTAALAVGDRRPFRPLRHTGIVANELLATEKKEGSDTAGISLAPLEDVMPGPVRLVPPLAQPGFLFAPLFDQLVVLDDITLNRNDALDWSPLPRPRGKGSDSLADWMGLPLEGPERVVVTGLPTAAETSLKGPRRGEGMSAAPGNELFQSVCALMASGARTVLVSRWRTGGQMNLQLVREFVQELEHSPADEAWQRSVLLAWETPLDAAQEPRLKRLAEGVEPPGANHPFFWAGYMLVDTGTGKVIAEAKHVNASKQAEATNETPANAGATSGAVQRAAPAASPQTEMEHTGGKQMEEMPGEKPLSPTGRTMEEK